MSDLAAVWREEPRVRPYEWVEEELGSLLSIGSRDRKKRRRRKSSPSTKRRRRKSLDRCSLARSGQGAKGEGGGSEAVGQASIEPSRPVATRKREERPTEGKGAVEEAPGRKWNREKIAPDEIESDDDEDEVEAGQESEDHGRAAEALADDVRHPPPRGTRWRDR